MAFWKSKKESLDTPAGIVERLAFEGLLEQRRARRWNVFFKMLFALYLLFFLVVFVAGKYSTSIGDHTALVNLTGVIGPEADVDADSVIDSLQRAFESKDTKGVVLKINSPGGSPVQSNRMYQEIRRLREKYPNTALYAVVDDICASGGYYVAAAADEIYADKGSLVGSIGVIMQGFGFVGTMEKLGVERRLITAGKNKGMLDPFSPARPADEIYAKDLVSSVHQQFIDAVKQGRGDRLVETDDTFSGLLWTGEQAKELGLVDEFGTVASVARDVIGEETIVDYSPRANFLEQFTKQLGVAIGKTLSLRIQNQHVQLR